MKKTFCLITNVSGLKYWSWLGTPDNTTGHHREMALKYGSILINDKGGFFTCDCVREIHEIRWQTGFPVENLLMPEPYKRPPASVEVVARVRKALKDDAAGNSKATMTDLDSACDLLDELLALKLKG